MVDVLKKCIVRSKRIELIFVRFHSFTKIQSDTRFATRLRTIGNFSEKDLIFYQLGSNIQIVHNSAVISTNDMYLQIFSFFVSNPLATADVALLVNTRATSGKWKRALKPLMLRRILTSTLIRKRINAI